MRCFVLLSLALLPTLAFAEPGVVVLYNSRQPQQRTLAKQSRQCLDLLFQANQLQAYQFWISSADFANPKVAQQWQRDFQVGAGELPALAVVHRQGNKIGVDNLLRRFSKPQETAEKAFGCVQLSAPNLVRHAQIQTFVQVTSEPAGARVWLDGKELGSTPAELEARPGKHTIRLEHPDTFPATRSVTAAMGKTTSLPVTLEGRPARLDLQAALPTTATIALDGADPVPLPLTQESKAGSHRYVVSSPGYYDFTGEFRAEPDQKTTVKFELGKKKLRLGLVGLEASGYIDYSNWSRPFPVEVNREELAQRIRDFLAGRADVEMVEGNPHCGIKVQIVSSSVDVEGQLRVQDLEDKVLMQIEAKRDMPFFTFDDEGSLQKRALEVMDEMLAGLKTRFPELYPLADKAPETPTGKAEVSSELIVPAP